MKIQNRYEYDPQKDLLGKGGFARVFRATDTLLHRDVALKVFSNRGGHHYSVLSEIRKVIGLEHPNLLRYYDVVLLEGTNNLGEAEKTEIGVMELANAGDLKEFARANPGSPLLYKLLKEVLLGLEYLHSKGIIHRDLKAQNILLLKQEGQLTAKISDFGISKDTGSGGQSSSMMVGTIEYMAPEQFAPAKYGIDGKVATNVDLWSFGIMVHELLTDSTPFGSRGGETTAEQIMMQILSTELPHDIDKLPEPYKSVVKKCLVTNAKERIRRASELLSYFNETGSTAPEAGNRQTTDKSTRAYPKGGSNARPDTQNNARASRPSATVDPDATKVYPKAGESTASSKAKNAQDRNPDQDQAIDGHGDKPGSGKTANTGLMVAMAAVVLAVAGGGWWYQNDQERQRIEQQAKDESEAAVRAQTEAKATAQAAAEAKAVAELTKAGREFKDCEACPTMVVIPGDSFEMGSNAAERKKAAQTGLLMASTDDETPQHTVNVRVFSVGKYAITKGQFGRFVQEKGYKPDLAGCEIYTGDSWTTQVDRNWRNPGFSQDDDHPVVCVSWRDAQLYAEWLSETTGKVYRLLSEAEREYSARAGTQNAYWWGDSINTAQANYNGNYSYNNRTKGLFRRATVPVQSFKPNPFGLYNMHGNVWEWVQDCYEISYSVVQATDGSAHRGQDGTCADRVVRGGGWFYTEAELRSANRNKDNVKARSSVVGFRLARTVP